MIEGGLDAAKKVQELERDGSVRAILLKSSVWLDVIISKPEFEKKTTVGLSRTIVIF